ncbi:hypothetical protein PV325_004904 [Microctonus aethiopoides]|uniref:Uncharacterized protein n=1 Tax=Microctonus aethiopoides TaxID=144406 RepID=A0AA39CAR1_9HYME|nr:hypothetical protein PV325_004904 [Microctonus aethiopoides]KAK0160958.1 hypothetical protein PV328_008305 [Microctonus aethiopoides]
MIPLSLSVYIYLSCTLTRNYAWNQAYPLRPEGVKSWFNWRGERRNDERKGKRIRELSEWRWLFEEDEDDNEEEENEEDKEEEEEEEEEEEGRWSKERNVNKWARKCIKEDD